MNLPKSPGLMQLAYQPPAGDIAAPPPPGRAVGFLAAGQDSEVLSQSFDVSGVGLEGVVIPVGQTQKNWRGIDVYVQLPVVDTGSATVPVGTCYVRVYAVTQGQRYLANVSIAGGGTEFRHLAASVRGRVDAWYVEACFTPAGILGLSGKQTLIVSAVASNEDQNPVDNTIGMQVLLGGQGAGVYTGGNFPFSAPPLRLWPGYGIEVRMVQALNPNATARYVQFFPNSPLIAGQPPSFVLPVPANGSLFTGVQRFPFRFFDRLNVSVSSTALTNTPVADTFLTVWAGGT